MDQLRGALGEKIEALSMAVGKKVGGLTDDVAALNDSLSQEKADRTTGDATLNTKLLEQVEKAREALAREMGQRAEEQKRKDSAVESTLQNLFMNVSQEKQQREDECGRLQQALYDEAAVRHAENTQLAEVVDRVRLCSHLCCRLLLHEKCPSFPSREFLCNRVNSAALIRRRVVNRWRTG